MLLYPTVQGELDERMRSKDAPFGSRRWISRSLGAWSSSGSSGSWGPTAWAR